MRVYETELPGRGLRYAIRFEDGPEFTIVIRNDGRRTAYWRPDADSDSEVLFEATEAEAGKLAEIFEGTYFHPVEADLEDALTDARIRWVHLPGSSVLAGATIRESEIRRRSGVTVIAVQRGDEVISNPDADTRLEADDVLVVVGKDTAHRAFMQLLDVDDRSDRE